MINFSKFNYSQGQKPIIIFYKQVDSNRILPLKSDIENIISSDCCTAMAIDEVKNSDYSLNIDAFKVFILVYSSNFSDIDAIERNWLTEQIKSVTSKKDKHIVLIALDTYVSIEWLEEILPRQQVTQLSNMNAMSVLYKTLQNRISQHTIDKINALPKGVFKVGELYYRAVQGKATVEVISENGDSAPTERRNFGHEEIIKKTASSITTRFIPTTEIVIPQAIKYDKYEYDVIGIGKYAFSESVGFETVIIPETVRYIDICAFSDSSLCHLTIPDSVTNIGRHAFCDCTRLTDIRLPSHLKSLELCTFKDCSKLSSISIPEDVETIDESVFAGCENLNSITIPQNVKTIKGGMFNEYIDTIVVDERNEYFDSRNNCNAVIDTITHTLIVGSNQTVIPENVKCIGNDVFQRNRTLESIVIPNGVLKINKQAFFDCWELKSVVISDSVLLIDDEAFAYCDKLTSVTLGRNILKIGKSAFYNVSYYTNDDVNRLPTIYVPKGTKDKYLKMLHEDFKEKVVEL